eukprot:9408807-Lingulodinium_polyedra.AAC.1
MESGRAPPSRQGLPAIGAQQRVVALRQARPWAERSRRGFAERERMVARWPAWMAGGLCALATLD